MWSHSLEGFVSAMLLRRRKRQEVALPVELGITSRSGVPIVKRDDVKLGRVQGCAERRMQGLEQVPALPEEAYSIYPQ